MTVAVGGQKISMPSAADFTSGGVGSTNDGQYLFAAVDSDGRGTVGAAGAVAIGIIQNKPSGVDRGMVVQIAGVSKLLINGSINEGDRLRIETAGAGTATTTDTHTYGAIALEAGASGAYIAVLVTPGQMHTG